MCKNAFYSLEKLLKAQEVHITTHLINMHVCTIQFAIIICKYLQTIENNISKALANALGISYLAINSPSK